MKTFKFLHINKQYEYDKIVIDKIRERRRWGLSWRGYATVIEDGDRHPLLVIHDGKSNGEGLFHVEYAIQRSARNIERYAFSISLTELLHYRPYETV